MVLFNFFGKKTKYDTITESIFGTNEHLAGINERLHRIETRQKETNLQLEEIDDFLQGGGKETALIDALLIMADTIYDFYYFTVRQKPESGGDTDEGSPLYEQAQMMWNAVKSAAETAGLTIIDAGNEPFDFHLHSVESTEQDTFLPNGYVIKTLKCGFIYKDEVIRRAAVVANKIELEFLPQMDTN